MKWLTAAFKSKAGPECPANDSASGLNLLLLSNGRALGAQSDEVISGLYNVSPNNPKTVLYIPYAVKKEDRKASAQQTAQFLAPLGIKVISAHSVADPAALLDKVDGIFVGGGNTFRLLEQLQKTGLLPALKKKVEDGMPYMGISAGISVSSPTIMTTNDLPIARPSSLDALNLVPFQISPHYTDTQLYRQDSSGKMVPYLGETRAQRFNEYHQDNATPVVALRDGSALRIRDTTAELRDRPAVLFRQKRASLEVTTAKEISALMQQAKAHKSRPHNTRAAGL